MKYISKQTALDLRVPVRLKRATYRKRVRNASDKHLAEQPVSDELFAWACKHDPDMKLKVLAMVGGM